MIVKTGANYQAEGGYIEAGVSNDVITLKTGDIDLNSPVAKSNVYCALVRGTVKLNGAAASISMSEIGSNAAGGYIIKSHSVPPNTKTEIQWLTEIDNYSSLLISTAGYTNPVLSQNSKNCLMRKNGTEYFFTVTGDDFVIDIVEAE